MTATTDSRPLWERDEQRWVDRRSATIAGRHGLRDTVARTLAWSELGYSSSGIAKRAGCATGTVRSHFETIDDEFGAGAIMANKPDQLGVNAPVLTGDLGWVKTGGEE